jgi:hypothetical protein
MIKCQRNITGQYHNATQASATKSWNAIQAKNKVIEKKIHNAKVFVVVISN